MTERICSVKKDLVGPHPNGNIYRVTLSNGIVDVEILNLGATIYAIRVPDRNGLPGNIALNYDDPRKYLDNPYYLGSTIGRVTGRIANGHLPVEGDTFQLSQNERGITHLHGGTEGFNKKVFTVADVLEGDDGVTVDLLYRSPDNEEGYPGNLEVHVKYTLDQTDTLIISYRAVTDKTTHVNLTNHSYFNLSGKPGSALNQSLQIRSNQVLTTGPGYLPTGDTLDVASTPYDFTEPVQIASRKQPEDPLFNEYYLLNDQEDVKAVLYDEVSGRRMKLYTSYPGLLFYSADFLDTPFAPCQGICLEAQYPPNAPNNQYARMTLLKPGEVFSEFIKLNFSAG